MAAVELRAVSKTYDGRQFAVREVSLSVPDGELAVFVGPSGCGKSTLLRLIAGLETISEGEIAIGGARVNDLPARERDIAMVFQDYALYPHKSVQENMAFGLRLRRTPEAEIRRRVSDAADLLQIGPLLDRKPAALSGGQRQRVAIGRAIVRQPKVFLFDEPLSNLDAQLRTDMRAEIKRLHQRLGATIIYVTHDQVEAMTLANRIAVLHVGQLQQYDTPSNIYRQPGNLFVAGFMGSPPMNRLSAILTPESVDLRHGASCTRPTGWATPWPEQVPLILGVRPEHVMVGPAPADTLSGRAAVALVEPLGAETLLTLQVGRQALVCRASSDLQVGTGDELMFSIHPRHLHAFHPDSGAIW